MHKKMHTFLFFFLFFTSSTLQARVEEKEETLEEVFISGNKAVAGWIDNMAEGLDIFLAGKKLTSRKNETSVRIENATYSMEGQGIKNSTGLAVNLRLPNLEQYWQVKFTTYDERAYNRGVGNTYLRPKERNYGATIGAFRQLGKIKTAFQPRIELNNPLKVSHSLNFETVGIYKTFQVNPRVEFFANPSKGTGIFSSLNFHFPLAKRWSLTLINESEYDENVHTYGANNGFSFGHSVSEMSALAYSVIFGSNNRETWHLDGYSFSVAWNHLIYKRILDYQIIPHWDFMYAHRFKGAAGLTVNVNLNF